MYACVKEVLAKLRHGPKVCTVESITEAVPRLRLLQPLCRNQSSQMTMNGVESKVCKLRACKDKWVYKGNL